MDCSLFPKWQNVLAARAWQPALHQPRGALGNNDFVVWRNVVAVRVRNESKPLCVPRIEPQLLARQIHSALKTNIDHKAETYFHMRVSSIRAEQHQACRCSLTPDSKPGFIRQMRFAAAIFALGSLALAVPFSEGARQEPKIVEKITQLPVAPNGDFEFRKTKLFYLSEKGPKPGQGARQETTSLKSKSNSPSQKTATLQDAPITFERQYRLFGAVTALDQRQRVGNYFDFFWRAKRPSDVTVRLEYRQEKLHEHVQAQEISYRNVRGTHKTEFKVVGDDYFDDGRVIAWRCLLIENGRIVAENRSFMWE